MMALAAALQRSKTARRLWHVVPYGVRGELWKKTLKVPRHPVTFNDKVHYKMVKDRRALLTTFADKVAVRDYVAQKAGTDLLTQLYLVTDDPQQIRAECLPREFVIKASHGCGGNVVVADHAPPQNRLPQPRAGWWSRSLVTPDNVNWAVLPMLCREWLGLRFNPHLEWAYARIPPRILAEELLGKGSVPRDYKFFVFHGRVRLVQVDSDRYTGHVRTLYSPDWERIPVEASHPIGPEIAMPRFLPEMISIAERLGQETDFVRVDLYEVGDRIVFGEMTNYPEAGNIQFEPQSFDYQLGSWWSVPDRYC